VSGLSTHVLDLSTGRPAADLAIRVERQAPDGSWAPVGSGRTDANGRIAALAGDQNLPAVPHRLVFDTGDWFRARGQAVFYPDVTVHFVPVADSHHHVPLLLSPYGYSTYRGS
jgi:5-hydroxyisourate hydrolase